MWHAPPPSSQAQSSPCSLLPPPKMPHLHLQHSLLPSSPSLWATWHTRSGWPRDGMQCCRAGIGLGKGPAGSQGVTNMPYGQRSLKSARRQCGSSGHRLRRRAQQVGSSPPFFTSSSLCFLRQGMRETCCLPGCLQASCGKTAPAVLAGAHAFPLLPKQGAREIRHFRGCDHCRSPPPCSPTLWHHKITM